MNALAPVRTVAPVGELLSLAGAKAHLKVEHDDEDVLIAGLVAAATNHLDGYRGILGCALLAQTWKRSFDRFPCGRTVRVPLGPLRAGATISYFDAAGEAQDFTAFHAVEDAVGPLLMLEDGASWPSTATRPDAVTVTWPCGFSATAEDPEFPAAVLHAVKLLITHWYENRAGVITGTISTELAWTIAALLEPIRKVGV
jgi:uncharacterized phiE125 gp8 family phage protein